MKFAQAIRSGVNKIIDKLNKIRAKHSKQASSNVAETEVAKATELKVSNKSGKRKKSSVESQEVSSEDVKRTKVALTEEEDIDFNEFSQELDYFCDSLTHFEVRIKNTQASTKTSTSEKGDSKSETSKSEEASGAPPMLFAFQEGMLVRAVREGHWLLLDEINLASAETLQVNK